MLKGSISYMVRPCFIRYIPLEPYFLYVSSLSYRDYRISFFHKKVVGVAVSFPNLVFMFIQKNYIFLLKLDLLIPRDAKLMLAYYKNYREII